MVRDSIIYYRVFQILTEMGLKWPVSLLEDFDVQEDEDGSHRLYSFRLLMRDDVDTVDFVTEFCAVMAAQNKISQVKADFHGLTELPGPVKNAHMGFLTVTDI